MSLLSCAHDFCVVVCLAADGKNSNLAGVVTLASSLDYTNSKSSMKLLLPLVSEYTLFNCYLLFKVLGAFFFNQMTIQISTLLCILITGRSSPGS